MMSGDLGEVQQEHRKYLEIVLNNANRLTKLINDMLDLSRIESGKLTMTFGRVDIKFLSDLVFLSFKPQAAQKEVEFKAEVDEGLAVSGDMERLQQALTNLVSNAIKYTPEGGSVKIAAYRLDGNVRIDVIDSGFGISPENQNRLFQKFFRVKNAKTRNIGGTGLGLCIAKSVVEAHQGEISVQSKEDKGSTFSITLPEYHG
jgi:signal transduction histidine kinase